MFQNYYNVTVTRYPLIINVKQKKEKNKIHPELDNENKTKRTLNQMVRNKMEIEYENRGIME